MNSGSYATSSKGILEILGVPMAKTGKMPSAEIVLLFILLPSPYGEGLGVRLGVGGEAFFHTPPLGEAGRGLGNAVEAVQIIRASGAVFVS